MEVAVAIGAFVIITVLYALSSMRARNAVQEAREDRNTIYRACFLRGLAGILAKMTVSDGSAAASEEEVVKRLFVDMGLSDDDLRICTESFEVAKKTDLPMSYYASLFAPYSTRESRMLVYEILWDIVAADGRLAEGEDHALRDLVKWLSLDDAQYDYNLRRRIGKFTEESEALRGAVTKLGRVLG